LSGFFFTTIYSGGGTCLTAGRLVDTSRFESGFAAMKFFFEIIKYVSLGWWNW
jgi:hypothetical protein